MRVSAWLDRDFGQLHFSGHSMGQAPMAFGLRSRFASPINELFEISRPWISKERHGWSQILDTFVPTDCDPLHTCDGSAERHGLAKLPIKSAVGRNVSRSWRAGLSKL